MKEQNRFRARRGVGAGSDAVTELQAFLAEFYEEREYPALAAQIRAWRTARPFAGKRILDATPVFRNTMVKYLALLAGGAELSVAVDPRIPHDPATAARLPRFGVEVLAPVPSGAAFDAVLDCAGIHSRIRSRFGYVELTHSGRIHYEGHAQPVFLADEGRIKRIETSLGTGDGFRRGMKHFGYGDFKGKSVVIFGGGKVGSGAALAALAEGARVTVIDDPSRCRGIPGAAFVPMDDAGAVAGAVRAAWCVVTATGVRHALAGRVPAELLCGSGALLANLGVEDEFGDGVPAERVLNGKRPLNFVLEEPTQLRYIDPTMALDNDGARLLLSGALPPGLTCPSRETEEPILASVREAGLITHEINSLEELL